MSVGTVRTESQIYVALEHKSLILAVIMALNTCKEHQGVHHFAVVGEGCVVQMSKTGYQCLLDQGISIFPGVPDV